jgi:hypothetical protein
MDGWVALTFEILRERQAVPSDIERRHSVQALIIKTAFIGWQVGME